MAWVEKDLKVHVVSTVLLRVGLPASGAGCPEPPLRITLKREETLRAEYGVSMLSDGNIKNEVENVKREMFTIFLKTGRAHNQMSRLLV